MFRRTLMLPDRLVGLAARDRWAPPRPPACSCVSVSKARRRRSSAPHSPARGDRRRSTRSRPPATAASSTTTCRMTGFGPYVDQIGRYAGSRLRAAGRSRSTACRRRWAPTQVELKDGDVVLWYWADFTDAGGPPTLELTRDGNGCYRVVAKNDAGERRLRRRHARAWTPDACRWTGGRACPGPHRSLVRAIASGAVRSNALT